MLEAAAVTELARRVAIDTLGEGIVANVAAEPGADWEGREALRIFVTLRDDYRERMPERGSSRILLALNDALLERGDERFPFIEYRTELEMAEDAGAEP